MLVKESSPFKLKVYKKEFVSDKIRRDIILGYPCIQADTLLLAGSYYKDDILILKKYSDGKIQIKNELLDDNPVSMELPVFIQSFKESEALDFVMFNLSVVYMITRGDKGLNVYMTNYIKYLDVFTNPSKVFWEGPVEQLYFKEIFDIKFLGEKKEEVLDVDEEVQKAVINGENEKNLESTNKMDDTLLKKEVLIRTLSPISQTEFENLRKTPFTFNLGKFKVVDGTKIVEFEKYSFLSSPTSILKSVVQSFSKSYYDIIEISGGTKISGINKGGATIWYGERLDVSNNVEEYIEMIDLIFSPEE